VISHILFDFKGPAAQSGPIAPDALEARSAMRMEGVSTRDFMLSVMFVRTNLDRRHTTMWEPLSS